MYTWLQKKQDSAYNSLLAVVKKCDKLICAMLFSQLNNANANNKIKQYVCRCYTFVSIYMASFCIHPGV